MKLKELEAQVAAKAETVSSNYKSDVKSKLCQLINGILKENNIQARADYKYSERENCVRIYLIDEDGYIIGKTPWPLYIEYKTKREIVKNMYKYGIYYGHSNNGAIFTLKSIQCFADELETIEQWIEREQNSLKASADKREKEISELKEFMKKNPDFVKMVNLYKKYQYHLD